MVDSTTAKNVKLVSWNVNGIRAVAKKGLVDFLKTTQPTIFCVQETKAHQEQCEDGLRTLGFENAFWSSAVKKGYSGTATFSQIPCQRVTKDIEFEEYSQEGRFVVTEYPFFDLYNIYFPNGGSGDVRHTFKQKFLKDLNIHLKAQLKSKRPTVVVGDYNVAHTEIDIHDPVRLSKESGFLPEERAWFDDFIALGFVDTFRHLHPNEKECYSWWDYRTFARANNRGWRIDYICISQDLLPHLKKAEIWDHVEGSDHCPTYAEFSF